MSRCSTPARTLLIAHGPLVTNPDNGLSFTRSDVDAALGGCSVDADCDDGLFCNGPETCNGGTCQAGTPVACSDGVSCKLDHSLPHNWVGGILPLLRVGPPALSRDAKATCPCGPFDEPDVVAGPDQELSPFLLSCASFSRMKARIWSAIPRIRSHSSM